MAKHDWSQLQSLASGSHGSSCLIHSRSLHHADLDKINGFCLYPAAGMLLVATEAIKHVRNHPSETAGYQIRNTTFLNALQITPDIKGIETRFSLFSIGFPTSGKNSWYGFTLLMYRQTVWIECCHGEVQIAHVQGEQTLSNILVVPAINKCESQTNSAASDVVKKKMNSAEFYNLLRRIGANYGPSFQRLDEVLLDTHGHATARLQSCEWPTISNTHYNAPYMLHPAILDALLQLLSPALEQRDFEGSPTIVPSYLREL